MVVEKDNKVQVEYEGRFEDGEVFDSSSQHDKPLEFITGLGMVVPGFDKAVIGMEKGEEKEVEIEPVDAYGEYNEEMKKEIPRNVLPKDQEPKVGMILGMQTPDGQQVPLKIVEVTDEFVKVDMNHPLAGKKLIFKLKVISYEKVDVEAMMKEMQEKMGAAGAGHDCSCGHDHNCDAEECGDENCACEADKSEGSEKVVEESKEEKADDASIENLAEGK